MTKPYTLLLLISIIVFSISCNMGTTTDTPADSTAVISDTIRKATEVLPLVEETKLAPNEISLTQADFPVVVTVPENINPSKVKVESQSWGGIEIIAGDNFQIQIASGQGDMLTRKNDLANDDVYKVDYLIDEGNAIMYKKYIPDTDIQEYHFYLIAKTSNGYYEVEDIPGNQFSKSAIMTMFEAAKKLKSIKG